MTVHVGELHTDVTTAPPPLVPAERLAATSTESEQARRRAEWIRARVAAQGFDD
jgi:hypothetical protein